MCVELWAAMGYPRAMSKKVVCTRQGLSYLCAAAGPAEEGRGLPTGVRAPDRSAILLLLTTTVEF